ncbi:CrcB family protein [Demequina globuliformis]|uniref:CrcB family protein n=1 Tax=Demequina globuliformis TaxID=676202 RepID=UPI000784172A|nr:CrcB family protein [Demequina globuliformis]
MSTALFVGAVVGCGLGAVGRYLLGKIDYSMDFPWHTVIANAVAAALVGALAAVDDLHPGWMIVLGAGLGGGLSTFSSLAVDAVVLWNENRRRAAAVYLSITFALGLACAAGAYALAGVWG